MLMLAKACHTCSDDQQSGLGFPYGGNNSQLLNPDEDETMEFHPYLHKVLK